MQSDTRNCSANSGSGSEIYTALFHWNESYSVKVGLFDRQHQKLFEIINGLHVAMLNQQGTDVLASTIEDLVSYTRMHFVAEEALMETLAYPWFLQHKREHDRLTRTVMEFRSQFLGGQKRLSIQLMDFLKGWLTDHISGMDKRYSEFLSQHGAK